MYKHEFTHNNKYHLSVIQINDEHSYDKNRSYVHIFVFFLRVGGSTRFKYLRKNTIIRGRADGFCKYSTFPRKKLKANVSINAFLHDAVEFLLKVKV